MADDDDNKGGKGFETLSGVTIALFAAVLAVNDLGAGKFGDDEMIGHNEKAEAYSWYQSKSVKQTLIDGQADLLQGLVDAGAVGADAQPVIAKQIEKLRTKSTKYDREKKEILEGSSVVGQEGWAQEDEAGNLGNITGGKQWTAKVEGLGNAGDKFDLGTLFLQISLVMGAISLVVGQPRLKQVFYGLLVAGGVIGAVFTVIAYRMAWAVG
jgi:hypothetical protein